MKRHFRQLRILFADDFEDFLTFAIEQNEYDKAAKKHFKFSVEDYMFDDDFETFQKELAK